MRDPLYGRNRKSVSRIDSALLSSAILSIYSKEPFMIDNEPVTKNNETLKNEFHYLQFFSEMPS